jgi:hypothetical protein
MNEEFDFPYSILDLRLVIAGGDLNPTPNGHWKISWQCQMSNLKWNMENALLSQFSESLNVLLAVPYTRLRSDLKKTESAAHLTATT